MSSKYKGFTLMEMMISMVVIGILVAASVPLVTQFSTLKTGVNKDVMKCITNNDSSGWYDTDAAGATILPTTDPCRTAVVDVQSNKNKSTSSIINTAEHGAAAQKIMAKRILRAACDQGGTGACDYFINTCRMKGLSYSPYCDDATDYTDLTYYLHLNRNIYSNSGATYIANQLTKLLPKMTESVLGETINAKTTAPNANDNIATDLVQPSLYIQACNKGMNDACIYAYNNNYNKSCYQVRSNWEIAPTQTYKLTYDNVGTIATNSVSCDMTNAASATITGCNSITANLLTNAPDDDCTVGYNNNYNRSCSRLLSNWSSYPIGTTYNLTKNGAPPMALVPETCPKACITSGPGTVCADGTVYAGLNNIGYYIYTTPADQGIYTWMTNPNTTFLGLTDANNGSGNTAALEAKTNPPDIFAPYRAAEVCYDAADSGYSDWYLPSTGELSVLYTNRAAIGNFSFINYYWTSREQTSIWSYIINFSNGNTGTAGKWSNYNVRCVRKQLAVDASCSNPGDTCSDGTKYAGPFSTYYLFTMPLDKGQFTWNNGYLIGTNVKTFDQDYGKPNHDTLIALADAYAPYNAALACKTLNDSALNGYTDWYLPARYELVLLNTNRAAIGGFAAAYYWTSTESNYYQGTYVNFSAASTGGSTEKYNSYRVRCVRRD